MDILNMIRGDEIFKNLFKHSTVGMSITSLDNRLHPNDAFCEMLGYSKEELYDKNWAEYTHPDDVAYNAEVIEKILSGENKSFRWEKRYFRKDGAIIWADIHTFLHRDPTGSPLHFITTVNNITQRKSYEGALIESEGRFSTLIRQMNEGVAIIDYKGIVLFANPAAETILGISQQNLVGKNAREIFGLKNFRAIHRETEKCLKGQQSGFEYELYLSDGSNKILAGSSTTQLKEDDRFESFVLFRDISARRRSEEEIRIQNDQLQQSNNEKDKFFAILAHDLRSPISSFLGLAEVMAEDSNTMTMSEIEEISKSLFLSASNLYQLLENLLEWSLLRRGHSQCQPEKISLNKLMGRSVEPFREAALRKKISLSIDLKQTYHVISDTKMTETIFRNLISNALKYTHGNGRVVISAKPVRMGEIEIAVNDTGIGMSEDLLSKLFQLNEQVCRKGTEGEASSGLGLLICKEFTEIQGGSIWAESAEDRGSTFYFTLKLAE